MTSSSFVYVGLRAAVVLSLLAASVSVSAKARTCHRLFEPAKSANVSADTSVFVEGYRLGTVEIDGRTVYFEHLPAARGKGTALLLTGLHTPQATFVDFKRAFIENSRGEGLIVMSYSTMPESMAFLNRQQMLELAKQKLTTTDFAREATAVINSSEVRGPVTVVGYSYGAAPASVFATFHRERISNLVFVTPLVFNGEHSLESANGIAALTAMTTLNPLFGNYVLQAAREQSARMIANATIGHDWSGTVDRGSVVAGLVGRIRATDNFDLRREDSSLWPRTHFILAENEVPARLRVQNEAFAAIPAERQPTKEVVKNGEHQLLKDQSVDAAKAILGVMRR